MNNFDTTEELVSFLNNTLIPDLRDSGSEGTADDFEDCVESIESLNRGQQLLNLTIDNQRAEIDRLNRQVTDLTSSRQCTADLLADALDGIADVKTVLHHATLSQIGNITDQIAIDEWFDPAIDVTENRDAFIAKRSGDLVKAVHTFVHS